MSNDLTTEGHDMWYLDCYGKPIDGSDVNTQKAMDEFPLGSYGPMGLMQAVNMNRQIMSNPRSGIAWTSIVRQTKGLNPRSVH